MKFELTLYVVLVFLVPSLIGAGTIGVWSSPMSDLIKGNLSAPAAGTGVVLLVLAFAIGSLIDALVAGLAIVASALVLPVSVIACVLAFRSRGGRSGTSAARLSA